jgi:UDP-N-acetylmuramoylalanine--D-glutamate ligase
MTWVDKRVVILGGARQGMALARYLATSGAQVTLSDMKPAQALSAELAALRDLPIQYVLNGHPFELLDGCDLLCLSGGVPIDLPIVIEAKRRNVPMSNDSQIFFDVCPAPIIGITGSAGKTTTTTLVGEMLMASERRKAAGQDRVPVWVGGNIGNPLIADVERIRPQDRVVMELSSFQLELMTRSPHVACITNITPNHLDRHGTMAAYMAAKRRILDFQLPEDWAVLNADNTVTAHMVSPAKTVWFSIQSQPQQDSAWLDEDGNLRLRIHERGIDDKICHVQDLLLMGEHNVLNVLAACAISALGGGSLDAMRVVANTFRGVAHRLQLVRELNGVRYYDDSIATTPERLMAALRCFVQPVVLLCGGRDKHLPWDEAVHVMAQRCKHLVLFGEMAGLVCDEINRQKVAMNVTTCDTLDRAVMTAYAIGQPGDVVLLSPGGTSFDAFKDFEERGNHFVQIVHAIGDTPGGQGVM